MTLGAYLQVYRKDGKAENTLHHFRLLYPHAPVFLVSDNGDDFSEICKKFHCHYLHDSFNVGVDVKGFTIQQTLIWLNRVRQAFLYCNSDYLLYLEDDVLVRKPILINPEWKIAGLYANPIPTLFIEKNFNTALYGACGGTVYETKTFLFLYSFLIKSIEDDSELAKFFDIFMPVLYMRKGYSYSDNTELTEPKRNINWKLSNHSIIHDVEWGNL